MQRGVMFACGGMVLVWFGTVCGVRYGGREEGKRGEETRSCVEVASEATVGRYCVLLWKGRGKRKKKTTRRRGRQAGVDQWFSYKSMHVTNRDMMSVLAVLGRSTRTVQALQVIKTTPSSTSHTIA